MNHSSNERQVFVIEAVRLQREAVARVIASERGLQCVGTGTSSTEAPAAHIDVLVIGESPDRSVELDIAAARANHPQAWLIVLVPGDVDRSSYPIADEVLSSSGSLDGLISAIRGAGSTAPAASFEEAADGDLAQLARDVGITPRQHEVLRHLARGQTPDQVARTLSIRLSTCRDHIKALHRALGCSSTTEVLVTGLRMGLLPELRNDGHGSGRPADRERSPILGMDEMRI